MSELRDPMVSDSWHYTVDHPDAELMLEAWSRCELPGPVFADWIEDRASDPTDYALPHLLAALRSETF